MAKHTRRNANENVVKFNEIENQNHEKDPSKDGDYREIKPDNGVDFWGIAKAVGYVLSFVAGVVVSGLIMAPKKEDDDEFDTEGSYDDGTIRTITTDPLTDVAMQELGLKQEDVTI